uniref:30S ribosomal protein S3 n=1 Tax=uncultured organism TaxID=155900 RepID=U3GQU8_9ZZZZ|nr:30S ribosomal protein S3 [uncultured organism]
MPRKVSPRSLRTGSFLPWRSRWFSERDYALFAAEDAKIRVFLRTRLSEAGLADVEIERSGTKVKVTVFVSKPGLVIGRGGSGIEILRGDLSKIVTGQLELEVQDVKEQAISAPLLAQRIAVVLERAGRRYRRAMTEITEETISRGARGIRVEIGGRIGGSDIARHEIYKKGSVPHSTLRASIDYAQATARTRYGAIGIKVWVATGEKEGKE